jgi:hypothetical protein
MAMSLNFKGMRLVGSLVTAAGLWLGVGAAQAAFSTAFSFGGPIYPDLFASNLSLDYSGTDFATASTLTIESTGSTALSWTEFNGASVLPLTDPATFSLTVEFSDNGGVLESGSLSITGGGGALGIPAGTLLLSANVFDFAINRQDDENGTFFFRLNNTASNASSQLGWDVPNDGQIIFNAASINSATWDAGNVAFTGVGTADTGVRVPTPATIALLGLGLIGLRGLRARRAGTV